MTDRSALLPGVQPSNAPAWLPAIAAAALSLALYAVTLGGTYIQDDTMIILRDPRIADPHLWGKFWTGEYYPDAGDNLYRPLVSMSYAVQWHLHGNRAWAFHLVNWLLAAATAASVAEFVRRAVAWGLAGSDGAAPSTADASNRGCWAGLIAGLLFAAHPVHVESIAGLVGRAELACTLATFVGFCLFLRRPMTAMRACGVVLCFFIALLSKEQGFLFPLMLAVLAAVRVPRSSVSPQERIANRWLAVSVIWSAAAYFFVRERLLKFEWSRQWLRWSVNPMVRTVGVDRFLMPLVLMGHYVAVLAAPYKLSLDYGGNVIGSSVRYHEPYLYLGIAAVLGWLAAFLLLLRATMQGGNRWPLAGIGVFALLGTAFSFGMVSNLTALIGTIFGERLAYMPSAFLAIPAGLAVAAVTARAQRWFAVIATALILLGSLRTVTYARQWNDEVGFYRYTLDHQPRSVIAHALVYTMYARLDDWSAAREVGEDCRRQDPEVWESWQMCFEAAFKMGRFKESYALIQRAAHVCWDDHLIWWFGTVGSKMEEQASTQPRPATQPTTQGVE